MNINIAIQPAEHVFLRERVSSGNTIVGIDYIDDQEVQEGILLLI